MSGLTVIILTFNSEGSILEVLDSLKSLATHVLIVDSGSSDQTVQLVRERKCDLVSHPFENYAQQRNFAQEEAKSRYALQATDWVLHLDSDEVLSPELALSIEGALQRNDTSMYGYLMRRLPYFMDQPIRFGHLNPNWHLRLFRIGHGECENRLYDQHFLVNGMTTKLQGLLLDKPKVNIERWTATHNRWSTAEAEEAYSLFDSLQVSENKNTLPASLSGDLRMKKRWLKNNVWYRLPLFSRAFFFFFYSYFIRLGFLDGRVGLVYCVLQAFWFRFLVDAKIMEHQLDIKRNRVNAGMKSG